MDEHSELAPLLTVVGGPMRGASFRLGPRPQVVGRAPEVDIPVADPHLSRRHAEVRLTEAGAALVDLGSTNGTWLNGRRITGAELLSDGDVVRLGRTELRVFDPGLAVTDPVGLRFAARGGQARRSSRPTLPMPTGDLAAGPTAAWPPEPGTESSDVAVDATT
ncbi:FHA domain-containing protein [Micromonospora sp. KC723]|uniref:FHA domain-containing protein n=1 Tax=Micromonospora sp. KC723 TaxID=2530381 RepID=UPI001050410B|nr:FHA domain-containing protein [Micromonospora sp. KC723]TDB70166.1 FHA domain-containing protein [Micromonospora sp. KC723]